MFFKKKDWKERSVFRNRIRMLLKSILWIFLAFSFTYFFLETIQNVRPQSPLPESVSSIVSLDNVAVAGEPAAGVVKTDPKLLQDITSVIYSDDTNVSVIRPEYLNVPLAEKAMNYQSPAEIPVENAPATINDMEMDKIEDTYEEELPEDIFEEELDDLSSDDEQILKENGKGYHIYHGHRSIREMGVIPPHKPWFFDNKPVIAIVIDDMGVSPRRSKDIISLNAPVTTAFLTYAGHLPQQVEAARKAGHEIMIHVPMQAKTNKDAAPDVLTVAMSPDEVKSRLEEMLAKFKDIKGINNHMGSLFTENSQSLGAVMEVLHRRNLFFLDSKTSAQSVGRQEARKFNVVYVHRHVFLDNENNVEYITKQLGLAEGIARRNGYAVAIGHPKSGTYEALKAWIPTLEEKGIKLVPMSKIAKVVGVPH